jgi:hypothetical protein
MGLMVGASTLALGMFAAMPANAFNSVDWTWDATVSENVLKNVDININIQPTGLVMLEDLQVSLGDITSTSTVHDISNYQPTGTTTGGSQTVNLGDLSFTGTYDPTSGAVTGTATAPDLPGEQFLTGTVNPESPYGVTMNFDLGSITVEQQPGTGVSFDALTQLPQVISAATSVGNNTSITADTAVELHEAQWTLGSVNGGATGDIGAANGLQVLGLDVTPAQINATSTVYNILNASVDSTATAVANNLAVNVTATGPDRLMMADVTQVAVADVTASSSVSAVDVYNYTNLGSLTHPLVNSVATAVGNNKTITVNAPAVTAAP